MLQASLILIYDNVEDSGLINQDLDLDTNEYCMFEKIQLRKYPFLTTGSGAHSLTSVRPSLVFKAFVLVEVC
jgi:hypothetical protein